MSDYPNPFEPHSTANPDAFPSWSDYPKAVGVGALEALSHVRDGVAYLQDKAGNQDEA
jgi:hypothetical protein